MKATIRVALAASMLVTTGSLSFASYTGRPAVPHAASHMQGPHLVELRKGWWVSSYECFTDEGYGRLRSCGWN